MNRVWSFIQEADLAYSFTGAANLLAQTRRHLGHQALYWSMWRSIKQQDNKRNSQNTNNHVKNEVNKDGIELAKENNLEPRVLKGRAFTWCVCTTGWWVTNMWRHKKTRYIQERHWELWCEARIDLTGQSLNQSHSYYKFMVSSERSALGSSNKWWLRTGVD